MKTQNSIDKQFEDIFKWMDYGHKLPGAKSVKDRLLIMGDSTYLKLKEHYPAISPIYTTESISDIEKNFDTFFKFDKGVTEPLLSFFINMRADCIGTYIGMTFIANYGGVLESVPDTLYIECKGVKGFPVKWVLSRLYNGKEDDILFKYLAFAEMVKGRPVN